MLRLECDECHDEIPTNGLPSSSILCTTCLGEKVGWLKDKMEDLEKENEKLKKIIKDKLENLIETFTE